MKNANRLLAAAIVTTALSGVPAAAQCFSGTCQSGSTLFPSDPISDEFGPSEIPFGQPLLSLAQFDPAYYAGLHGTTPDNVTLIGAELTLYGEIDAVVRFDNQGTSGCNVTWSYDVYLAIFSNPAIGNPGILAVVSEGGTEQLGPGDGDPPPPWQFEEDIPLESDTLCFPDQVGLGAWTGTGTVEFMADGFVSSSAQGCSQLASDFSNLALVRATVVYHYCVVEGPPPAVGTAYCFGDGSGTACPCDNAGASDEGCANSTGAGAILSGDGSASVAADDLTFDAAQLIPSQPALLFAGENQVNGGDGLVFGDGLRCAGGNVKRLGVRQPDANGDATWGPGLQPLGLWQPGDTRRFQAWYRDPNGGPCGLGFNLSHGYEVVFVP